MDDLFTMYRDAEWRDRAAIGRMSPGNRIARVFERLAFAMQVWQAAITALETVDSYRAHWIAEHLRQIQPGLVLPESEVTQ